ncbi:L,D-transpeptidase family protein [Streptomyces sp. NPDC006879]|uniref:L,D-transpeptidase family protein n=1 Tax=Streptomyces sp. NPDC006879 TaxID=3364767 RepID=UPI0036B29F5A
MSREPGQPRRIRLLARCRRLRTHRRGPSVAAVAWLVLIGSAAVACGEPAGDGRPTAPAPIRSAAKRQVAPGAAGPEQPRTPRPLPGISDTTRARIPDDSRQVVLVRGEGPESSHSTVTLYQRAPGSSDWRPGPRWPARNGAGGWSQRREAGDLTSPEGVFRLTDAGGRLPAPTGTLLPYDQDRLFVPYGQGVNGEPLDGVFDHVIAVNYNRVPGSSPLDERQPDGEETGGNIWLHVDHDGPTRGCVGVAEEAMRELLKTLDPAQDPVVVMGPPGM